MTPVRGSKVMPAGTLPHRSSYVMLPCSLERKGVMVTGEPTDATILLG